MQQLQHGGGAKKFLGRTMHGCCRSTWEFALRRDNELTMSGSF
jgi:hypothetical protein